MPRSLLNGKTLGEKRNGPGWRDYQTPQVGTVTFTQCFWSDDCGDPVEMVVEQSIDDHPPVIDAYTRMLAKLPVGAFVSAGFCMGHGEEVVQYGLQVLEDPDTWAPGRENPFVFPHPPKMIEGAEQIEVPE